MESNVFQRTTTTDKIISDAKYNLTIGAVLLWGFLVNWILVEAVDPEFLRSINIYLFLALYCDTSIPPGHFSLYLKRYIGGKGEQGNKRRVTGSIQTNYS